ncbi:hypothetical protein BDQ17DRAFT_1257351, partial [Cyathus striatus]
IMSKSLLEDLIVCTAIPALSPPKVNHFPIFTKLLTYTTEMQQCASDTTSRQWTERNSKTPCLKS